MTNQQNNPVKPEDGKAAHEADTVLNPSDPFGASADVTMDPKPPAPGGPVRRTRSRVPWLLGGGLVLVIFAGLGLLCHGVLSARIRELYRREMVPLLSVPGEAFRKDVSGGEHPDIPVSAAMPAAAMDAAAATAVTDSGLEEGDGSLQRGPPAGLVDDAILMRGMQVEAVDEGVEIGTFHLLAIGIDGYQDDSFPPLRSAAHGARTFAQVLTENYTFKPANCVVLYNADATAQRIIQELRRLAQIAGDRDSVVIYFAGHGYLDALTQTGSWIPVEGRKNDTTTWISNVQVKILINAMKARHVLLISDSCFAGDFFRGTPSIESERRLMKSYRRMSRWGMTSGGMEPVTDGGRDGHSIFTYFLLKALSEADGIAILAETIFDRIKGSVRLNARQSPKFGILHDTGGEIDGQFVFFSKRARTSPRLRWTTDEPVLQAEPLMEPAVLPDYESVRLRQDHLDEQIGAMTESRVKGQTVDIAELADLLADKRLVQETLRSLFLQEFAQVQKILASHEVSADIREHVWDAFLEKWRVEERPRVGAALTWGDDGVLLQMPRIGQPWTVPNLGVPMVPVQPGSFHRPVRQRERLPVRGSAQRQVIISRPFWIAKHELTQAAYEAIAGNNPSQIRGEDHPVDSVSWEDAVGFCKSLTAREKAAGRLPDGFVYRLPSEAEWEYTCRAGSRATFCFGDDPTRLELYAWVGRSAGASHHPVGRKKPNAWGIHDMHGNVFEWCLDGYDHYPDRDLVDPVNTEHDRSRVARGGSFGERSSYCGSGYRHHWAPSTRKAILGFRVVLAPALSR